jgi:hypothetical protein
MLAAVVCGLTYVAVDRLNMSQAAPIEFALHGKVEGVEITPRTIGLPKFNEYNQQVEAFIGGSQKLMTFTSRSSKAPTSSALRSPPS